MNSYSRRFRLAKIFYAALALLPPACLQAQADGAADSAPRKFVAGDVDVPREEAWSFIQSLIDIQPNTATAMPLSQLPQIDNDMRFIWVEATNRILREWGYWFYTNFNDDPRRWEWLVATMDDRSPWYFVGQDAALTAYRYPPRKPAIDEVAREQWQQRQAKLTAELLKSPQATVAQKAYVHQFNISTELTSIAEAAKKGEDIRDRIIGASREVLSYGADYEDSLMLKQGILNAIVKKLMANQIVDKLGPFPDALSSFYSQLRASRSPALNEVGNMPGLLERAAREPMEMKFTAIDGREVDLSKMRGRVVMIDFTAATWCSGCLKDLPIIHDMYARYHEKGFDIVAVSCDFNPSDREAVLKYIEKYAIEWPIYFEGNGMQNRYARRYGMTALPEYLLLDRNGLLVWQRSKATRSLEDEVRDRLGLSPLAIGKVSAGAGP